MFQNYEAHQAFEEEIMEKWAPALESVGTVSTDSMAKLVSVLLENYMGHLKSDKKLILEDRVENGAFNGVNTAILKVLARTIPKIVGLELVGHQAMTTRKSPVFHKKFFKDTSKGGTTAGDELWVSPQPEELGIDPDYSASIVRVPLVRDGVWQILSKNGTVQTPLTTDTSKPFDWANRPSKSKGRIYVENGSIYVDLFDADGKVLGSVIPASASNFDPNDYSGGAQAVAGEVVSGGALAGTGDTITFNLSATGVLSITIADDLTIDTNVVASAVLEYEYDQEDENNIVEMSYTIDEIGTIEAKRRTMRAKFTADSEFDLKKYWGFNLQEELFGSVENELITEINKEIVRDLKQMAANTYHINFATIGAGATGTTPSIAGNYEDMHRVFLDAIEATCAKIWNVSRIGRGNWILGNPVTLAFMDRMTGFSATGVKISDNSGSLSYAGQLGSKIKIYHDPTYPENEILVGYKGAGALDTGYLHCPYLPLTASPILLDPETGDPSKVFYTRYGKTYNRRDLVPNKILMGQYLYAKIKFHGMPSILGGNSTMGSIAP